MSRGDQEKEAMVMVGRRRGLKTFGARGTKDQKWDNRRQPLGRFVPSAVWQSLNPGGCRRDATPNSKVQESGVGPPSLVRGVAAV